MSVFTSRNQQTLEITHNGEPVLVTIRELTPRRLREAKDVATRDNLERNQLNLAAMGGAEFYRQVHDLADAKPKQDVKSDPLDDYDIETMLRYGIVSWSDDAPVTPEAIGEIREENLRELATALLKMSKPSLFKSADEQDADRKNG